MSHDSVNRFLNRESYSQQDLFNEVKPRLNLQGETVSVDDSVLDKPYAHYIAFVGHYWSRKHHAVVKGINLITLYYTDPQGQHQPVNFRVYDKADNKTKNDYFLDMLAEALSWGLEPAYVTGDSWYSCVKNLKTIKNHQLGFLFALESNRLVSIEKLGSISRLKTEDRAVLPCGPLWLISLTGLLALSRTSNNVCTINSLMGLHHKAQSSAVSALPKPRLISTRET